MKVQKILGIVGINSYGIAFNKSHGRSQKSESTAGIYINGAQDPKIEYEHTI